jgi:CRISPR/Cas system-associated endonuclease Cas1
LNSPTAADVICGFQRKLSSAESFDAIRIVETTAAAAYFREWRFHPVMWPKADVKKIPDHWRFAGSRQSPLTGGPRLAVTPVHAVLNYCFALLQSETRLCLSAHGLDPGLGIGLHPDTANRDSFALDVLEPIRPEIVRWPLNWISSEPLRRSDFFETGSGNGRLVSGLCKNVSDTCSVWRKLVAPWAEYVAQALWTASKPKHESNLIRLDIRTAR